MATTTPYFGTYAERFQRERAARNRMRQGFLIALMTAFVIPFAAPVFWMIATSFKSMDQIAQYPPQFLPNPFILSNYADAFKVVPLWRFFGNTTFYAVVATVLEVFGSSVVAFGFAKFRAPGRNILFLIVISTILIPFPVLMVPQYVLFQRLGWINTYLPLIVPYAFGSAFLIFMFRQFMRGIPNDFIDAARIDGAGVIGIYFRIIIPLSWPSLIAGSIIAFSWYWNNYLGPLMYLNSEDRFTLQQGLAYFIVHRGMSRFDLMMAAAIMATLPLVIIFFVAQRKLIQGIVVTGLK